MANSFIGFPVPRAKIADMILSSAPPTIHHTQHEKGGADEIDCTGLTGAGGGAAAAEPAFEYRSYFDSIDAWDKSTSGNATINLTSDGCVEISTSYTKGSYAILKRKFSTPPTPLNFDHEIHFKTTFNIFADTDEYGTVQMLCSLPGISSHIGFVVTDGILKGSCGNGQVETTIELETLGQGEYMEQRTVEAILRPGSKCEFYVEGIKKGEITSNLPSGEAIYTDLIYLRVDNGTHDKTLMMWISYIDFKQYP